MSQKQRLQELLQKLKEWSDEKGDETLEDHIATLSTEIQLMDETNEGEGGNHPLTPPGKA